MELQQGALAVAEGKGGTFLHKVVRKTVDTAFRELRTRQLVLILDFFVHRV